MLAHETLSDAGFHVIEAARGREALDILEARPEVSALFSEVDMPVLDGFSLARLIAMRWPHIPVLITSCKASRDAVLRISPSLKSTASEHEAAYKALHELNSLWLVNEPLPRG